VCMCVCMETRKDAKREHAEKWGGGAEMEI